MSVEYMICPNCHTELPKDHLYCEKCGTEIQIVPIFEPELEESIHETLSGVADVIVEESDSQANIQTKKETHKGRPKLKLFLFGFFGLFAICLITYIFVLINQYCSFDYQYQKAQECFQAAQYDEATGFAKRAIAIDDSSMNAQILLSDIYLKYDKYDEALAILLKLMDQYPDQEEIYERVVSIYDLQGNLKAIQQLIEACENVEIASKFDAYIASPPSFSLEEGTYDEQQTLKLLSDHDGSIYYTLDGSTPDENSLLYVEPIILSEGIHVVKAIYVNTSGTGSEVASKTYQIKLDIPDAPEVTPKSGNYNSPESVTIPEIAGREGFQYYYTEDDSEPDENSIQYVYPIPMRLGKSHYKFIAISPEGIKSDVTEVNYNLNISSLIDTGTAENAVVLTLYGKGELLDLQGTYKDGKTKLRYRCTAAAKAGARIYYLVEEFKLNGDQEVSTERYYGVDVRTGELYHVTVNQETGAYEFSLFSLLFN